MKILIHFLLVLQDVLDKEGSTQNVQEANHAMEVTEGVPLLLLDMVRAQ